MERLDPAICREYRQAMEVVPDTVRRETAVRDFVRTDAGNVRRAMLRLALYWKYRKEAFGTERWLLPMTQTGAGALSLDDLQILRTGFLVPLWRGGKHGQGPVMLLDMSRLPSFDEDVCTRCVFYIATTCTDEYYQTQGMSIVHVVTSARRPMANSNPNLKCWDIIRTALPIRIKTPVLVVQQPVSHDSGFEVLVDSHGYNQSRLMQGRVQKAGAAIRRICGDSIRDTVDTVFAEATVQQEYLPHCLGGFYNYTAFTDWVRMRLTKEDALSSLPCKANAALSLASHGHAVQILPPLVSHLSSESSSSSPSSPILTSEQHEQSPQPGPFFLSSDDMDTREFIKKRNALYSRRRYHKKKLELKSYQEQVTLWQSRNVAIRKENERLEARVSKAQAIVAVLDSQAVQFQQQRQQQEHQPHQPQQQQQQSLLLYSQQQPQQPQPTSPTLLYSQPQQQQQVPCPLLYSQQQTLEQQQSPPEQYYAADDAPGMPTASYTNNGGLPLHYV